jgi:hypothetical protein
MKTHCINGHELIEENIYFNNGRRRGCKLCRRNNVLRWEQQNPDKKKESARKTKARVLGREFGITSDEIFAIRSKPCEICGGSSDRHGKSETRVDHDHLTNVIRGSLCDQCNMGLGKFLDSEDLLLKAVEYLRRYKRATA